MPVRWLFLDMNAFFASVEQQVHPELRGRPVAVAPLLSDATCCIAASYEAKAYGVKTGTNVGEARRLCPNLRVVEAKHEPYREFHHRIVSVVGECLPIDKVLSVDEMYGRLWSNERDLPEAIRLGEHIKTEIRTRVGECLHCSVGLGPNPFLAKVAAELHKPNGLSILDDEDLPRKLYGLRLRDFPGIGANMETRLNHIGVTTTQQMYGLTCDQMRRVWGGVNGERWWRLLRGEHVEEPPSVRRSVSHSHVLTPELRTPQGAASVAGHLLEKAAVRLRSLGCCARALSVYLRAADRRTWQKKIRFAPCADIFTLMDRLQSLWEHPFPKPCQVGIVLWDLVAEDAVTGSLFENGAQNRQAMQVMDTLNTRFGKGTVTLAGILPVRHMAADKIAFGKVD